MSEPEKKGSPWPWILVPVAAVSLFFVLRECRQSLPPAESVPDSAVTGARGSAACRVRSGAGVNAGAAIDSY